jgi:hypothetical protein
MHSTNSENTFIEIAEDCPVAFGETPPMRGTKKSVACLQFEMLQENPYKFDSDHVIFPIWADRKEILADDGRDEARNEFFSKGQACFRASPLTKRYGWGVHSDEHGKIAIYGAESEEYKQFVADDSIKKVKAMRSSRKKKKQQTQRKREPGVDGGTQKKRRRIGRRGGGSLDFQFGRQFAHRAIAPPESMHTCRHETAVVLDCILVAFYPHERQFHFAAIHGKFNL